MYDYSLNEQSQKILEKRLGLPFSQIRDMSAEDLDKIVERRIGKTLKYGVFNDDSRLIGRGSVYLYLNRLFDINNWKLNRLIDKIKI